MILFEEAYKIVMDSAYALENERIDIKYSLNRVLAEDAISDIDMPPFDKSAMDGYACRREDLKNELKIIEIIQAGMIPQKIISKNKCTKIMTGAIIPEGANCVIMVEHTEMTDNNKIRFTKSNTDINICYKGEDIKTGDMVLKKGTQLKPQHIAVLASVGYGHPLVVKQLKISIISTGNELVEPYQKPELSQIRNSNSYQLIAQVKNTGAIPDYTGIFDDSETKLYQTVIKALSENDVVLLTGGVSMGDYDLVPEILEKAKIQILFKKIATKPGKPTVFGIYKNKFCFGLPGNPVSSFIMFEFLVKPFLYKMMGIPFTPIYIKMPIGVDYKQKLTDRIARIPVKLTKNGFVLPVEYHGSAHIHSICEADGIISIPIGKAVLNKGEIVDVRQI